MAKSSKKDLIDHLEELITEHEGDARRMSLTLKTQLEVLKQIDVPSSIKVRSTRFCLINNGNSISQISLINTDVTHETSEYLLVWENLKALRSLKRPIRIEFFNEKLDILDINWDDPRLPEDLIDSLSHLVEPIDLGIELEEYYEGLEHVDFDDFPNQLLPLIRNCINEYKDFKMGKNF